MPEPENLEALRDLRPMGQIHDSFIIAAGRDGLWIIDQHVAHERILFEQVLALREGGRMESQRLLVPMVVTLNAGQSVTLTAKLAKTKDWVWADPNNKIVGVPGPSQFTTDVM